METITHVAGPKRPDGTQRCTRCGSHIEGGKRYSDGAGWPEGALVDLSRSGASRVTDGATPKGRECIRKGKAAA